MTERCEDCGHPRSNGTWVYRSSGVDSRAPDKSPLSDLAWKQAALVDLRCGKEPRIQSIHYVHYSPCDEECRHHGRMRFHGGHITEWYYDDLPRRIRADAAVATFERIEASWRDVEVRFMPRLSPLTPSETAMLCLRCWAARTPSLT